MRRPGCASARWCRSCRRELMPSLENTLGRWYSPGGPQVLARFGSPLLAAQPFAAYQVGAGEMDGDAAAPEAVDRLLAQRVSAAGPSLSSARDRAWMPGIHSGGCDRRARRRWLRQCLPLGIPTDAILACKRDTGATGTKTALTTSRQRRPGMGL